ncbi:MAG: hypothetical protein ACREMZ_16795 [Gemmatimonadales bacterium]
MFTKTLLTDAEARAYAVREFLAHAQARIAEIDEQVGGHKYLAHQDGLTNALIMEAQDLERQVAELESLPASRRLTGPPPGA